MPRKTKTEIITKAPLFDTKGKQDGVVELDAKIFNGECKSSVMHQAVRMYMANKRVGQASTKVRNEVAGGGKKPWRQKGTGRARAGSIRSPLWRHGGVVFGPHPRNFKYQIPKKIKRLALAQSINAKIQEGLIRVISELKVDTPKTKTFVEIIDSLKLEGTVLIAVENKEKNLTLATRNIDKLVVVKYSDLNAYDVLRHDNFVITKKGLELLSESLKG